jgi:CheY-like chemotaxis protein
MCGKFALIIADRNRHVRDFLKREFEACGFIALPAKDEMELLQLAEAAPPPDLLILDLDPEYFGGPQTLEELHNKMPDLPVVIHTLLTEEEAASSACIAAAFLEKRGNNIDLLKETVMEVLHERYPARFDTLTASCAGSATGGA